MGSGIYSIGVSALQNAQLGLATTSHNIANASTEGYNRQRIIQATNVPVLTGAGYVGQGAHVSTIERVYSSFISKQINSAQAEVSSLEAYSTELTYLNNVLSDTDSGLSTALESFFTAVQQVSSDPSSLTTRQTLVSSASALTSRFQGLSTLIEDQYESVNNQIQGVVASINSYSQQIATLNEKIINAESATGQPPNDLYDQRDQLLLELNKLIGATASTNTDGSYNVYFGNGQPLVVGTTVTTLTTKPSAANPQKLGVAVANSSGTIELPESVITGGSLSGLMEYRSSVLDEVATRLDEIADALATTFNAQHVLGQDLQGNAGGDFFTSTLPSGSFTAASITVNPDVLADVRLVAAAAPVLVSVSSDNTGSATVSAGTVSSGYSATPVALTYAGAGDELSGFSEFPVTVTVDGVATDYTADPVPYTSGATYTTGGVSFTVSGAPDDGDQIVIELNTGGVSDNRNMLLLGSLQTAKTMAGGTATYATVYSQLVSYAGAKGAETETKLAAQTSLLTAAEERREELSGVNLDEEAVNLLKYQQEYQAAAKMLQIASELFDAVLNIR
jgi:flagellar hook-associated protein 1 FlgK